MGCLLPLVDDVEEDAKKNKQRSKCTVVIITMINLVPVGCLKTLARVTALTTVAS